MLERPEQGGRAERPASRSALKAAVFIALAVLTAGLGALLLTKWVNARTARAHVPTAPVVVAAVDLAIGTQLRAEHLSAVDWPAASRPASAVSDPAALVGRVVATRIFVSEAILAEKLAGSQAGGGLAALLPDGMRAVAVRVDDVVGVAGFIHPGDYVDVIVTITLPGSGAALPVSKTILQAVKVLAVGKEVDAREKRGEHVMPATVATLMVNSADAERLALAASKGQLLLALRSSIDSQFVQTGGVAPPALISRSEYVVAPAKEVKSEQTSRRFRSRVRVVQKAAVEPAQKGDGHVVEILRGDLFEKRDFDKGTKR
jgi:pilus assembly protein CpaB